MWLKILCLTVVISVARFEGVFTLYPLTNDYFDIIYEIKRVANSESLHNN